MADVGVGDFSLYGLLVRIAADEAGFTPPAGQPTPEQVKQALNQALPQVTALPPYAKAKAEAFLQPKVAQAGKDEGPNAEKKRKALADLLAKVKAAGVCDAPPHVQKATKAAAAATKAFEPVAAAYGKWERGKTMFKNVEDLKELQKSHAAAQAHRDKAWELVEQYRQRADADLTELKALRAPVAAQPKPAPKPKAAVKAVVPQKAVRQAEMVAALREAPATTFTPMPRLKVENPTAAELGIDRKGAWEKQKKSPQMSAQPAPRRVAPVLSFQCTVAAMAEHLQVAEDEVRLQAERTQDLKKLVSGQVWEKIEDRSVQIEKRRIQEARDAEKQKANRMIAKVTAEQSGPETAPPVGRAAPKAASSAKPKPKPVQAPLKPSANAFAALAGGDDADGFAVVRKKR